MISHSEWKHDNIFEGISENGNTILFDADTAHTHGPSPMEAVLMALCGCTSVDVVSILKKKRQPLTARLYQDQADLCGERQVEPQGCGRRGGPVEKYLLLGVEDVGEISGR
jgi:putative redox protein